MFKMMKYFIVLLIPIMIGTGCNKQPTDTDDGAVNTWVKTYGGNQTFCGNVIPAADGNYFIIGANNVQFEPDRQGNIYLIKVDSNGDVLWEQTYSGQDYKAGNNILELLTGS